MTNSALAISRLVQDHPMRSIALCVLAVVASPSVARADWGDPFDPGTCALQMGAGLSGMTTGGIAGGFLGLVISDFMSAREEPYMVLFGALGAATGAVVGVKLAGEFSEGTGGITPTVFGALGGAVAAGVFIGTQERHLDLRPALMVSVASILFVGGTVIGYQIGNDGPASTSERRLMLSLPVASF